MEIKGGHYRNKLQFINYLNKTLLQIVTIHILDQINTALVCINDFLIIKMCLNVIYSFQIIELYKYKNQTRVCSSKGSCLRVHTERSLGIKLNYSSCG